MEADDTGMGPCRDREALEDLSPQRQERPLRGSRKGTQALALLAPMAQNRFQEVCQLIFLSQQKNLLLSYVVLSTRQPAPKSRKRKMPILWKILACAAE